MQKVKQKVPKDKSHLDPGQAKLLEIALIFWRYELSKKSYATQKHTGCNIPYVEWRGQV